MIVLLWSVQIINGQSIEIPNLTKSYSFINEDLNVFSNQHLVSVMEKLYQLKGRDSGVVNILHIGDSHLQADFITSIIRTTLQKNFGNAGRGFVVPYHVAKTNEPFNYASFSSFHWQSKRCVFPNQPLPIGIGGVTISTSDSIADFNFKTFDDSIMDYGFNKLRVFYQRDSLSYKFEIQDSLGVSVGISTPDSIEKYSSFQTTFLPTTYHHIKVKLHKTDSIQTRAIIYGLLLENCKAGIIYNTVGVNGAEFEHYSKAEHFSEQTKMLNPDLVIFSLGTNEAFSLNFNQDKFYSDIQELYNQLKKFNPNVEFLITTPACSFKRKKPNTKLPLAAKTIIKFAIDNKIAYWDLQGVTGGNNSAPNWKKNHMLRKDGVHFSRIGYKLQGDLFCQAFLKAYNEYVTNRPK